MTKPKHHLFICGSVRAGGEPQGICHKKQSIALLSYLQNEIQDRMLEGVEVAMTGCLNLCTRGPVMIDYPSGHWYQGINEGAIDAILDALEEGRVAEEFLMKE
jgi:(2Fe-2S) ferredoxin